jgi:hypothetical protein
MSTTSPARVEARVPDPFPRAGFSIGHRVWRTRVSVLDWAIPFADRITTIATLVVGVNRIDAAVLDLGSEIDSLTRDDLRSELRGFKGRRKRAEAPQASRVDWEALKCGEAPEAWSVDWAILYAEVDSVMQELPFQMWYALGEAIGRYHFEARARDHRTPLPDFGPVLDQARRVFEEVGRAVPVLAALVEHAPRLAATGPGRLLREVLAVEKYGHYPDGMGRVGVCSLLDGLAAELDRQLAGLTRPNPALPPFYPTPFQERLLRAVRGKALTAKRLEDILRVDRKQLYCGGINPLKAVGRIENNRRLGGYYDPTAPPEKK